MDTQKAIRDMWSIADKPERMRCFHKIVFELGLNDAKLFWSEFWNIWQSSENLHEDEAYFVDLIEHGLQLGSSLVGLDEDEQDRLAKMADKITVYRGSVDFNQEGYSWTTDRDKAKWFAGRSFGSTARVLLRGTVNKSDILAFLAGRGESEIVINPEHVIDIEIDEQWEAENEGNAIFYAVQSGRLDQLFGGGDEMNLARANMTVASMSNRVEHIGEFEEMLAFCEWGDLRSKQGYFREVLRLLRDDSIPVPDLTTFQM